MIVRILIFALIGFRAAGHDIPNDVVIQTFFRPEGQKMRLLVRVPMKAMRDVDFPQRGQGFLDFERAEPLLRDAAKVWIADEVQVYEDGQKVPTPQVVDLRVSLESDKSFQSYDQALAHIQGPKLGNDVNVAWNQTFADVLLESPIRSAASEFSIHPGFGRLGLRVATGLRYVLPDGTVRAFEFNGDPGVVTLDPRWYQAALLFVKEGLLHILSGGDHLLFLACLVIPFRKLRALIPIVTAFTVAHSITLIASAYDLGPDALWFPPLVETLIAASILYMAVENIVGTSTVHRRWIIAFCFGLVHGFGFSFALKQTLQFAGSHLLASLLAFNVGIELGQLLVLAALVPVLELLFRKVVAERLGIILLSAFIAHTGWHWMIDRGTILMEYRLAWPQATVANIAIALRWLIIMVAVAGALWLVSVARKFWKEHSTR